MCEIQFLVIPARNRVPESGKCVAYLQVDHWNDFSYVTMFALSLHDESGAYHEIGRVKIGFKGQTDKAPTYKSLSDSFKNLSDGFFSLGQGTDYYKKLYSLPLDLRKALLEKLQDITANPEIIESIQNENVFGVSLLRDYSLSIVKGQFARVLEGYPILTDFFFRFKREGSATTGEIELDFNVYESSKPSTNIHALIGRNGIGKTTLLNEMIQAVMGLSSSNGNFYSKTNDAWSIEYSQISSDYFSSLVSVSFSAFDPFIPPQEQPDPAKGTCYFYIGLKDSKDHSKLRNLEELRNDCARYLLACFSGRNTNKLKRWIKAIKTLGSDENFKNMRLNELLKEHMALNEGKLFNDKSQEPEYIDKYLKRIDPRLSQMSSGHFVVLLTLTGLIARVEEKTLVLMDEPESHLHPPLLSAFIRALSYLLYEVNGVAIIATHSPVVLQEIPKSCVSKIVRSENMISVNSPKIETFGENVGLLTSEVFGLEVSKSGFHTMLSEEVNSKDNKSFEQILSEFDNQLGFEGRGVLAALIARRDAKQKTDEHGDNP